MELTEAETQLIEHIRKLDWGKVEVVVQNNKPVIFSVKRDFKLTINLTSKK